MAALYDLFRTPQLNKEDKVSYHARSVVSGKMNTRDIARALSRRSSFKEGEVMGMLMSLEELLIESLRNGKSVHLNGIGTFRISAQSPLVYNRKEIRSESIKFKGVVYKADKQLLKQLVNTRFMRVESSHCSVELSESQIDTLLTDFFKQHDCITTKQMQVLCGLSNATALRRLKSRVKEGKLAHPGHVRAPFYFPIPGNYEVGRE